jgi:PAS domain S-box-containing protein
MSLSLFLPSTLLVGAVGYLLLAGYVWRYRSVPGARPLGVLMLAVAVWTICYSLELRSRDVASAELWSGLKFIGIVAVAPAMWAFVIRYTERNRGLPRWAVVSLSIEPVAVLVLLAIPATQHLIHYYPAEDELRRADGAPVNQSGPLFWPHAIYNYLLLLGAIVVLGARLSRVARPYRRQATVLIAAAVLPLVANMLYSFDVAPVEVDPTPFLFTLTAAVLVWGFVRLRLLDVMPVARDVIVERMTDAVVVIDVSGRVIDLNPAGAELLGCPRRQAVGRAVAEVAPGLRPSVTGGAERPPGQWESTVVPPAGEPRDVAVSVTPLADPRGRQTAQVLVLRDITDLKRTERQLRGLLQEKTELSDTLRQSLRPSSLLTVPGVAMAARSLPADRQEQVTGDFYDVHPAGPGRWAIVLGDVAGRGVQAAVLTATARYTLRMLSTQGWRPSQVLGQLNHALLTTGDLDRFCTVAYGVLDGVRPASGNARGGSDRGGMLLTLSLGGHPPPLLLRRDGTVEPVGVWGTALGLFADVEHHDTTIRIAPGEVLLAYTDGVVEARRAGEQFGEERLGHVLAEVAGPLDHRTDGLRGDGGTMPGTLAGRIADGVVEAVERYAADLDDLAVLVVIPDHDRSRAAGSGQGS